MTRLGFAPASEPCNAFKVVLHFIGKAARIQVIPVLLQNIGSGATLRDPVGVGILARSEVPPVVEERPTNVVIPDKRSEIRAPGDIHHGYPLIRRSHRTRTPAGMSLPCIQPPIAVNLMPALRASAFAVGFGVKQSQ